MSFIIKKDIHAHGYSIKLTGIKKPYLAENMNEVILAMDHHFIFHRSSHECCPICRRNKK